MRTSLPNGVLNATTSNGHGPSDYFIPMPASLFSSMMKAKTNESKVFRVASNAHGAVVAVNDDSFFLPINNKQSVPGNILFKKMHLTQKLVMI